MFVICNLAGDRIIDSGYHSSGFAMSRKVKESVCLKLRIVEISLRIRVLRWKEIDTFSVPRKFLFESRRSTVKSESGFHAKIDWMFACARKLEPETFVWK